MSYTYSEKDRSKKIAFREKYGRKPNKEEIKMLKKNLVDLSGGFYRPRLSRMNISDQLVAKNIHKSTGVVDV